jgi:hypothetical protein
MPEDVSREQQISELLKLIDRIMQYAVKYRLVDPDSPVLKGNDFAELEAVDDCLGPLATRLGLSLPERDRCPDGMTLPNCGLCYVSSARVGKTAYGFYTRPTPTWKADMKILRTKVQVLLDGADLDPAARPARKQRKKPRGAPVESDPRKDKRLCEDWQAAKRQGTSKEEFARAKGIRFNDLIRALDRERERRRRDAE